MSIIAVSWLVAWAGIPLALAQSFSITPSSLPFPQQAVGTSNQQTVALVNTGSLDLTLNSFTLTPSEFQLVNGYAATLSPQHTLYFTIKFVPDAAQTFTGSLTLNLAGFPPQVVPLSGTGVATHAMASLSATALDFGSTTQGTEAPMQTVTVTNTGTSAFRLLSANADPPFIVSGFSNAVTVKPGSSTSLQVSMYGAAVGSFGGELSLTFDVLPPQSVSLAGTVSAATAIAVATFPTLPYASPGAPYLATLIGSGGTGSYGWRVAAGSALPRGLHLSSRGSLTGTLSSSVAVGNHSFSAQLTDSSSHITTAQLTLPVALAPNNANCNDIEYPNSSTPDLPLTDLGTGIYMGEEGGLYPGGSNVRPPGQDAAGVAIANAIQPLDSNGNPDPNGKYVLLSIGMSETQQEFVQFASDASTDPSTNPHLVIINGAQDSIVASDWADINFGTWNSIINYFLPQAGVTANQVVAAWVKSLNTPSGTFPSDEFPTQANLESIAQNLHTLFPNLQLAYFATTIYSGYGNGAGNGQEGEPNSYEGGFAVKWAIQDQINGNPNLNFNPALGPVLAPWMSWGSYDWANGLLARSDGLVWACAEYLNGNHPNSVGRETVSNLMLTFFKTDDSTRPWFLDPTKLVLLSSTSLAFGDQVVGTTSASQNLQVTNNQALPLNLTSISTTAGFAQTNNCGSAVVAGGTCTISVTFDPATIGAYSGSVTMADDAPGSPQVITLSGTGVAPAAPAVSLSPASLSFPAQVSAFASCTVGVDFTPTVAGAISGALTVPYAGTFSPQEVSLSGTGELQGIGK